jgi:hypothetical protein
MQSDAIERIKTVITLKGRYIERLGTQWSRNKNAIFTAISKSGNMKFF